MILDRSTPMVVERWLGTLGVFLLFALNVILRQGVSWFPFAWIGRIGFSESKKERAMKRTTAEFEAEYSALLNDAYPATAHGTLFPFRRIFAVARKRG